ncbi:cytidine deaminase [Hoeflea sp. CAU 1731]
MTVEDDLIYRMLEAARSAHRNAYVPYCRFPVSACVKGEGAGLYVGVNIDNKVPGQTVCAESVALGSMIAAGECRLTQVLVLGGHPGTTQYCMPCGGCRQRLYEFADDKTLVHSCLHDGRVASYSLLDLLPS